MVAVEFSGITREYAWDRIESGSSFRRVVGVPQGDIRQLAHREVRRCLRAVFDEIRPSVVAVNGWSAPDALAVLGWASERQVPVVMMSDTTSWDFRRSLVKEWVKRRLVGQAQAGLVGGAAHAAYIQKLGMPASSVFTGYDVVDNEHFLRMADHSRSCGRPQHLPKRPYFLASSRFIPKKNLARLLEGFAVYRRTIGDQAWELVLLGDGGLRPELERQRDLLGLRSDVRMPGFKQYGDLIDFYAWAGAFVHASTTEQWGLVVNEAMASGLPVLVSERCGCALDLVQHGVNGFTFDPYDVGALGRLLCEISSDTCDRAAMGRESQTAISRWTPEAFAFNLERAAETALRAPRTRAGLADRALRWAVALR